MEEISPGTKLRTIRKSKRLTIREVAESVGISPSLLSMVENDRANISLLKLRQLCNYFGIGLSNLFSADEGKTPHSPVIRSHQRKRIESKADGVDIQALVPDLTGQVLAFLVELQPKARTKSIKLHQGEEFAFVLQGNVQLHLEEELPISLETGDSTYFSGKRKHSYCNHTDGLCSLLVAVNSPLF